MLARALKLQLTGGETLLEALNALVSQKWAASVVNGQTILSTSEAGGSVTFTFDRAYTPAELAILRRMSSRRTHLLPSRDSVPQKWILRNLNQNVDGPGPCSDGGSSTELLLSKFIRRST